MRTVVEAAQELVAAPEIEAPTARALQRDADVFKRGEMAENGGDLEAANHAPLRDFGRF